MIASGARAAAGSRRAPRGNGGFGYDPIFEPLVGAARRADARRVVGRGEERDLAPRRAARRMAPILRGSRVLTMDGDSQHLRVLRGGRRPQSRATSRRRRRSAPRWPSAGSSSSTAAAGSGLMGAVADAALAAGGRVIGVIPIGLVDRELAHAGVTELRIVNTLHERKAVMAELADAFLALPGGLGTLEELAEVLSWAQLGLHEEPIGALDVGGFFRPLIAHLDHAAAEGFISERHRDLLIVDDDLDRLLERFEAWESPGGRFG